METCDDGNTVDGDGCAAACTLECGWECPPGAPCRAIKCGDGLVAGAEQCDDGNAVAGDGCSALCQLEGKSAAEAEGWACSTAKGAGTCTGPTTCKATVCGNKVKEGTEQCDDGNTLTGDGCSPLCRLEPVCPPGGGPCSTVCGSGLLLPGDKKQCDDGNTVDGDGCSATCTIEPGFSCTNVPVNPNPLVLPIVYRDFQSWKDPGGHPDFEHWVGLGQAGLAAPMLSTTNGGVPVRTPGCILLSANGCPSDGVPAWNAATDWFGMWYVDNPTYNKTIVKTLTFSPIAGGAFQYNNESFFPLDGQPGTWGMTPGLTHNYGFTSVTRYWFEYTGAATLTFVGDDDVFVYINKKLAVDLGGTHSRDTGSITLDAADGSGYVCDFVAPGAHAAATACDSAAKRGGHPVSLGLVKGSVYEIAVFQAERHTVDSHYQLTLSKFSGTKSACVGACGDGVVVPPETCDLGKAKNTGAHGGCNADCTLAPYCGDKIVQAAAGEECDGTANCSKNCKTVVVQ
jgi:fibro-slime domain-containing protein